MPLLKTITQAYETKQCLSNSQLYEHLANTGHIHAPDLNRVEPIGEYGKKHSVLKRKIRWYQQTLKTMGVIESTGTRGQWRLSQKQEGSKLPMIADGKVLLAYATDLGVALWEYMDYNTQVCVISAIGLD